MKKLQRIFPVLIFVSLFSASCQKEEDPWSDPACEHAVESWTEINQDQFLNELLEAVPDGGYVTPEFFWLLMNKSYSIAMQGGQYMDYNPPSIDDWFYEYNFGKGGPYCGGTHKWLTDLFDWINANNTKGLFIKYAVVSVGNPNDHSDPRGHVYAYIEVMQDGKLIWVCMDAMFNHTFVLRSDESKLASYADMKQWKDDGTLHTMVRVTDNVQTTRYLQEFQCVSYDHPIYNANKAFDMEESGREDHPYNVLGVRDIRQYAKYQFGHDETFTETYTDILSLHGYQSIDITKDENLIWPLVAGIRTVYWTNDPEFGFDIYKMTPEEADVLTKAMRSYYRQVSLQMK